MNTTLNNLATRTLYGLIFAAAMVVSMLFSPAIFALIMLFFVFEGSREMIRLHNSVKFSPNERTVFQINAVLPFLLAAAASFNILAIKWIILWIFSLLLPYLHALFSKKRQASTILVVHWQILFFIVLPASLMVFMQQGRLPENASGPFVMLTIILLIWINDIFAYLSGISFGRHKLFSRISPKKTWEGSIGGLFASLISAWFLARYTSWLNPDTAMPLAFIIVITGSFGDLIESMLKRQSGIKDSGKLIPGHGGVLDRFDATFFSVPFAFTYLYLIT